jgi:hypothetical protein
MESRERKLLSAKSIIGHYILIVESNSYFTQYFHNFNFNASLLHLNPTVFHPFQYSFQKAKTNFLVWTYRRTVFLQCLALVPGNELWSEQTLISNSEWERGKNGRDDSGAELIQSRESLRVGPMRRCSWKCHAQYMVRTTKQQVNPR